MISKGDYIRTQNGRVAQVKELRYVAGKLCVCVNIMSMDRHISVKEVTKLTPKEVKEYEFEKHGLRNSRQG